MMKPPFVYPFGMGLRITFAGAWILLAGVAHRALRADLVTSVANGSWDATTTWDNGLAPDPANDYLVASGTIVNVPGTGSYTFGGGSMTVNAGGILRFYPAWGSTAVTRTHTINNLTLNGGILEGTSTNGSMTHQFAQTVAVTADSTIRFSNGSWSVQGITLQGGLSGAGNLDLLLTYNAYGGNNVDRTFRVSGGSPGYAGDWSVRNTTANADTLLVIADAFGALGTGQANLGTRATLRVNSAGAIDTLSALNLTETTARLQLNQAWTNDAATLAMITGSQIDLADSASRVGVLQVDGNNVAPGIYTSAQLSNLGLAAIGTGTLEVLVPEPGAAGLLGFGLLLLRLLRRPAAA